MAKKFERRNSTTEFLIFMAEGKEDGVPVIYNKQIQRPYIYYNI